MTVIPNGYFAVGDFVFGGYVVVGYVVGDSVGNPRGSVGEGHEG
jgi:hypothetical protein